VIVLERDELRHAALVGIDRRLDSIAKGRRGNHGFDRDDFWRIDIEGAAAEAAVAKFLGVPYAPDTTKLDSKTGDVQGGYQVRSTKYDSGSMLVHNSDADDHVFILVTGENGKYKLRGWRYARDCKHPKLWKDYKGRGSYWVPQSMLLPMKDLPR
jgi:hypothetical protein